MNATTAPAGTALLTFDLNHRRQSVCDSAPWSALADSLTLDLESLIAAPLPIPAHKARLTRIGGRCPVHGTLLEFDPFAPADHHCLRCQRVYRGREHDDWWAMGALLWTAERAVHAAALYAVRGDRRHADLAARILREFASRYRTWPNRDNVLGPTRPFFSTYLESIWLLNLCHAVALLESVEAPWSASDRDNIRRELLAPSAALIDSYHEGRSNRQVWNEVAVMSAWQLLGDDAAVRRRLRAPGGLCALMADGLLDDGTWYEGENYHLFAHRGLWYGVELMRTLNEPLAPVLNAKYSSAFLAPFLGLLPDDTLPARRDSQYASSIRQWRTAEWCELGWAHTGDAQLAALLTRLYDTESGTPRRDTGRAHSTADAERNLPPSMLSRADLSWRALLMASTERPPATIWQPESVCLRRQGLAVMRGDEGRTYVALEGGEPGGGHGHPDQLALTLQTGPERWLRDPGTGSYVSPSLHWYRSTLAHAAPAVDYASQRIRAADTRAFDERRGYGWMVKAVDGLADGVQMQRTIVVADSYLIDLLEWDADAAHTVSLPIAGVADVTMPVDARWEPSVAVPEMLDAHNQVPTSFLTQNQQLVVTGAVALRAYAEVAHNVLDVRALERAASQVSRLWYAATAPFTLQRSNVPGAPGQGDTQQHRIDCRASHGTVLGVWSWPTLECPDGVVASVELTPRARLCVTITRRDGAVETHDAGVMRSVMRGSITRGSITHGNPRDVWTIESTRDGNTSRTQLTVDTALANATSNHRQHPHAGPPDGAGRAPPVIRVPYRVTLGREHYVPTERSWSDAGSPTADVQLSIVGSDFVVDLSAHTGPPITSALRVENPLDNEHSAVNCDGVQWYFGASESIGHGDAGWTAGGLQVPDPAHSPAGYAMPLLFGQSESTCMPEVQWHLTEHGWTMRLAWPVSHLPINDRRQFAFELVVNECSPDRERRRGQLVLSGGGGFGYLAGDRRPFARAVAVELPTAGIETTLR